MEHFVSVIEPDGIKRDYYCWKYENAVTLFHKLTRHYLYVELSRGDEVIHVYDNRYID
jgi:hypothetical protein